MALVFSLRPATERDLESLAAIEQEAFSDPSWGAADFLRYDCVVAEVQTGSHQGAIGGFLVSRETFAGGLGAPPEREILNIAVAAEFRRLGVGTSLLENEKKRGSDLFLEVRESNVAAIQMYKNAGFTEISRRPDYYQGPTESAIVMRMKW